MKKIYIHIGHAKTGSSAIQKYFKDNGDFNCKNGVLYPITGLLEPNGIGHHHLHFVLNKYPEWVAEKNIKEKEELYEQIKLEINDSSCNKVVISSEGFSSVSDKSILEDLKRLLQKFEVQIILYVRKPDKWAESWYGQVVKDYPFTKAKFNQFVENNHLKIYEVAIAYADVFGMDNISLINYENVMRDYHNVSSHFCDLVDLNYIEGREIQHNVTPSAEMIELLRNINESIDLPINSHRKLNKLLINELSSKYQGDNKFFDVDGRKHFKAKYLKKVKVLNHPLFENRLEELIL